MRQLESRRQYWRTNITCLAVLLAIWFVVSYGFGILLVDQLDRFRVAGFPVGFWSWSPPWTMWGFPVASRTRISGTT